MWIGYVLDAVNKTIIINNGCCKWVTNHTPYNRNIMRQKWEGDCGLWVLNETIFKRYAESMKKILGAV